MPFLKGLYGAVMEEPTWNERIALLGAVSRGLGRAAVHDLLIDPLTVKRMNHQARISTQVGVNALSTATTAPPAGDLLVLPELRTPDRELVRAA